MQYKNRILRHYQNEIIDFDNGSGTFTAFDGDYSETTTGLRLKYLEANGNFYFTSSTGIKKISASSASEFSGAPGYIVNAGAPEALDITGVVNYTNAGFFLDKSKVAYKVTWAYKDANDNLIEGVPSARLVMTNYSDTESATVDVTFAIPSSITSLNTEYFYRIYRTQVVQAPTVNDLPDIDPGEEMNLVIEDYPSAQDLIDRSITVADVTPDDFRAGGALLYNNPVSGEGILQSNYAPPLAQDIALFQNSVFYANTQNNQQINLNFLSISQLVDLVSYLEITQGSTVNRYTFRGRPEITDFTFDTQANTTDGGYFLINAASNVRKYFVWFDKTGTTIQPSAVDTIDRLPIRVDISTAITASDVATAVEIAINTVIDFTASALLAVVGVSAYNGNNEDAVDGLTPVGGVFAINVVQQGYGEGQSEETDFTFDTKVNTTDGGYFLINSAGNVNEYFVWADKTGSTPEPSGLDTIGRTGIRVDLSSGSIVTANDVALAFQTEINTVSVFLTEVVGATLTTINALYGPSDDAVDGLVPLGGAFTINVVQQGDNYVLLSSNPSPSQAIDETARSLVNIINNNPAEVVNAFYLSGPDDVPGLIMLKTRDITTGAFALTANNSTTGSQFNPILPTSGTSVSSTNEVEPNVVYYSKFQQPEAVPIVNKFTVGPKDKAILRILPLRDSLFVLKEDGLYRITGQNAQFVLDPFDSTTYINAPDSAVVLNNQIYMLSSQGIVAVSDTGVSVISRPIENIIDRISSSDFDFKYTTFGVSYESDRAYLLWIVSNTNDTVATQCYRFNTFTTSWTRFPISKTCAVVKFDDDKLYLGAGDENFIERERKNFLRTDYSDRQYDLQIGANAIDGTLVTLSSVVDVEVGDVILQTQYLSIYQFNQILLMLDNDFNVTDNDYYSTLSASAGANLRDGLDALAAKLDADPGVNNSTFVASLAGGTSFTDLQDDFNIIVNLLNTASGTHFKNYKSSDNTVTFEALVTEKIKNSTTVRVKFDSPLIEGPVISYRGIKSAIIWAPQTFGDASVYKQVSEGTFLFENTVFYSADVSYASDMSQDFQGVPFNESGLGDWNLFVWGRQNWGGEGSQVPLRTYVPRNKQRCRFIKPQFQHLIAREKFSLFGLSLSFRAFSSRAYRE